jgi:threonine synthase
MQLYSTKNRSKFISLKEAVFKGLPEDNGLYMPMSFPKLPNDFIQNLKNHSFQEIAFEVSKALIQGYIPDNDLKKIIKNSITFPAPVVKLDNESYILELFHGPSLAFKDFGAKFMSQLMSYFNQGNEEELVILVATSGDTGGAVASGFYKTEGIKVVILYPSGKVSDLQEKQLTTLGHNITALEVNGTFDDCQKLVKKAFLDPELSHNIRLSSANSINIARLIPQSFYYFESYKQVQTGNDKIVFSIPSGNFGNLTAGLFAKKMGLPIHHFIAATNVNDIVPEYLRTRTYTPRPSIQTLSNAMDVGNPSNFSRILDLDCSTGNIFDKNMSGYSFTDSETKEGMKEVYSKYSYELDPHGAVGYLALKSYQSKNTNTKGVILETAHPSKFIKDVENILQKNINIPERLAVLKAKKKKSIPIETEFNPFKQWLLSNY